MQKCPDKMLRAMGACCPRSGVVVLRSLGPVVTETGRLLSKPCSKLG